MISITLYNASRLVRENCQIISNYCLLVYEAVKTTMNDQVGWWGHMSFFTNDFLRRSKCAPVVRGGVLDAYVGEQGLSVAIQE